MHFNAIEKLHDTIHQLNTLRHFIQLMLIWRVRGKIITSVLCNIVRNNCAQCNAHTYERT